MSITISEHALFRPKPSKAESKADVTNNTARAIIGSEEKRREEKTARLRLARLAHEATVAAEPAPAPAAKKPRARAKPKS